MQFSLRVSPPCGVLPTEPVEPDHGSKKKSKSKHMNFKTTFLASILAIAGVTTLSALPWDAKYNRPLFQPKGSAASAAVQNPCCNIKTRLVNTPNHKGHTTRQEITCKDNCKATHTGKNCSPAESRNCR